MTYFSGSNQFVFSVFDCNEFSKRSPTRESRAEFPVTGLIVSGLPFFFGVWFVFNADGIVTLKNL